MKAKRIDGQAVNGKRTILSEVLPLDTPYSITFFPIYACNFKCNYCLHSLSRDERGHISDKITMDIGLFKKCIDDIATFPQKVKAIHFAGLGEPLLHQDIVEMVTYVVKKEVAHTVDILTNGALLTEDLSNNLIKAGLTKLRVSIQGLNEKKYKEIAKADIDFNQFYKNLRYFYECKGNTQLYIKIIDSALDLNDEEKFLNDFGDICDNIAIERLCPFVESVDYNSIVEEAEFKLTMNGNKVPNVQVCPQPFYSLQIYPDGNCIPCCTVEKPLTIGDCNYQSVPEIWYGRELKNFRKMHLSFKKSDNSVCARCQQYKYSMFQEEVLDNDAERLLQLFE